MSGRLEGASLGHGWNCVFVFSTFGMSAYMGSSESNAVSTPQLGVSLSSMWEDSVVLNQRYAGGFYCELNYLGESVTLKVTIISSSCSSPVFCLHQCLSSEKIHGHLCCS